MKRYQMSESLPVGLLLALAGGILDSYTYLNRGQVFATAETGNLVLLGIHLAQGELGRVLSCLFPILAFALGVLTTEGLRRRLSSGRVHWRQPILAAECLVILVVSFCPREIWTPWPMCSSPLPAPSRSRVSENLQAADAPPPCAPAT